MKTRKRTRPGKMLGQRLANGVLSKVNSNDGKALFTEEDLLRLAGIPEDKKQLLPRAIKFARKQLNEWSVPTARLNKHISKLTPEKACKLTVEAAIPFVSYGASQGKLVGLFACNSMNKERDGALVIAVGSNRARIIGGEIKALYHNYDVAISGGILEETVKQSEAMKVIMRLTEQTFNCAEKFYIKNHDRARSSSKRQLAHNSSQIPLWNLLEERN